MVRSLSLNRDWNKSEISPEEASGVFSDSAEGLPPVSLWDPPEE